jgi:hypothetical protein
MATVKCWRPPASPAARPSKGNPATFWPGCIPGKRDYLQPMMMCPSKSPRLWLFSALFAAGLVPALLGTIA